MLLVSSKQYFLMIAILYIILIYVVIKNCDLVISNKIDNSEIKIEKCINNALSNLDLFLTTGGSAIDKSLCSYGKGRCIKPSQ